MFQFLRDRRSGLILLGILALLFALMAMQIRQGGPAPQEGTLLRLASPVLRGISGMSRGLSELWGEYVNLRHTRQRNTSLEERLTLMNVRLQQLEEAGIQNHRLRGLLDLKEGMGVNSVAAIVIGNNSTGLSHTILLDRGSEAKIEPNMGVISATGVVGRVWTVSTGVSKVQLITDVAAGTAVLVQRTRVQGILLGAGADLCTLEYVLRADDVRKGDLLVTSGLDGIYPKGLAVAEVWEVSGSGGLLRRITAVPRVEFNHLEEVLVLRRNDIPIPDGLLNQAEAEEAPRRPAPEQLPPR